VAGSVHVSVMLREVLQQLNLSPGLTVVDGTLGAAGHSQKIVEQIGSEGTLVGLDRDPMMLGFAAEKVSGPNIHLRQANYLDIRSELDGLGIESVDRILLDLGLSSDQLADRDRGFGYSTDAPLDMRFDVSSGESAADLLAHMDESSLTDILQRYGEERFSESMARHIVERRRTRPLQTTGDLTAAVNEAIPAHVRRQSRKEPSTRVFQALRIAVNDELRHLEQALDGGLWECLTPGGRLVVITFHSLEDRLVKNAFRGGDHWQVFTRKPITPTPAEIRINPRSRSARLRTAVKQ